MSSKWRLKIAMLTKKKCNIRQGLRPMEVDIKYENQTQPLNIKSRLVPKKDKIQYDLKSLYAFWQLDLVFDLQFAVFRPALLSAAVVYKTAFFPYHSDNPEISGNPQLFFRLLRFFSTSGVFFPASDVFFSPQIQGS